MEDFGPDMERCLQVLKNGGTILYPTDTIWGIGCDATNPDAVKKIYDLKKRPDEKSLIVLVADEGDILKHVTQLDLQIFDYLKTVQKPTTVIYDGAIGLADNLVASDGSIAIRICREKFCLHLLRRFKRPIVSTSANISGHAYPRNFFDIPAEIKGKVDYAVNYRQGDKSTGEPSALIKWKRGEAIVLRS